MVADRLSGALVARLKERAGNADRRTDASDMAAHSVGFDDMLGQVPKSDDPAVREYLEGMNTPFAGMISNMVTADGSQAKGLMGALGSLIGGRQIFGMMGDQSFSFGAQPEATTAAPPCSEEAVAAAEAAFGFALPPELRQIYLEVADGGVGPGDGVYGLAELQAKWHEMTDEPVGEDGEHWPANLLPIHGEDWDLTSIDSDSGKLVFFDAEEIEYGGWAKAFKPEADSLEAWLDKWLGARTPHEQMQDEMAAMKSKVAEEWIARLEVQSEAHRASHGFTGDDWRNQVRERAGAPRRED